MSPLIRLCFLSLLRLASIGAIKPTPRWGNGCIILTGSLYCFGGQDISGKLTNDLLQLNLNHTWDTSQPPWELVPVQTPTPPRAAFAIAPCSTQAFVINGGRIDANSSGSTYATYLYDTQLSAWSIPAIQGDTAVKRRQHSATADYQGRIWLWGGVGDPSTGSTVTAYYSMWTVLEINSWTYSTPAVSNNLPVPRIDHTATMISNEKILIMGGVVFSKNVTDPTGSQTLLPISMNQLLVYDTARAHWETITAGGNIPAPRRGHSAVLHQSHSSIIIFGGESPGSTENDHDMLNDVFVLRLSDFEWNSPSIYGVPPKPRIYHQANMMDQLMLVSFGQAPGHEGYADVNILNTAAWQWISTYTPNPEWLSGNFSSNGGMGSNNGTGDTGNGFAKNTDPSNPSETKIKAGIIAGIISGAVVVAGGGIFLVLSKALNHHQRQPINSPNPSSSASHSTPTKPLSFQGPLMCPVPRPSSIITLTDLGERHMAKPDNRSSFGYAIDDGLPHKPNEHDVVTQPI
ncbi:galactose oxidase [Hesseltinella vesiculosa]|uniref:Galactose oxidase n=1 Tax=Hesseltinella vesiculosa TaxID=101127 RepID=A0A1X2GDE8_9FUNG|nr:galactose oxidase [Hesseltinella vesiculosa]